MAVECHRITHPLEITKTWTPTSSTKSSQHLSRGITSRSSQQKSLQTSAPVWRSRRTHTKHSCLQYRQPSTHSVTSESLPPKIPECISSRIAGIFSQLPAPTAKPATNTTYCSANTILWYPRFAASSGETKPRTEQCIPPALTASGIGSPITY